MIRVLNVTRQDILDDTHCFRTVFAQKHSISGRCAMTEFTVLLDLMSVVTKIAARPLRNREFFHIYRKLTHIQCTANVL